MNTKIVYPAILTKEDNKYLVEFPDLPGCITYGDDLQHAIEMAEEVLPAYIITMLEEDQAVPKPSSEKEFKRKNNQEVTYIKSDISQFSSDVERVKKTLTIPKWLDEQAKKESINFSKTLEKSLVRELNDNTYE